MQKQKPLSLAHCHQGSETGQEERPFAQKGSVVLQGEAHKPKFSLLESSVLLAEKDLRGGLQKCSAHVKVCVSALTFKQGIWGS